jgi:putative choline binding protein A
MENQNILTIKFNTLDDLAVQVADWNERLNHQCQGQCMSEKPIVKVKAGTSLELAEGITRLEAEGCKVEILENEVTAPADDVPVTDFEGKPTKTKKEEKVEPVTESVVESAPAETPTEEPATIETPEQDAVLDVTDEPVDKKAFYKEFREWMGEDGVKAKKALAIFGKHGVTRPSSDSLTDDIITDLKSAMAGEE